MQTQFHYAQPVNTDPMMAYHHHYAQVVAPDQNNGYYTQQMNPYPGGHAFGPLANMSRAGTPQLPSGPEEKKDKKNATTTAANEKELRELLDKNETKSLDDIARDVRQAERTQKSERAKQLFAMRW